MKTSESNAAPAAQGEATLPENMQSFDVATDDSMASREAEDAPLPDVIGTPDPSAPAQDEAADSTPDDTDDDDTDDEPDKGESPDSEERDASAKPRKNSAQKRISKLSQRLRDRERELEFERGQRAALERLLKERPATAGTQETADPDDGKPKIEDYDTTEEYGEAYAEWRAGQAANQQPAGSSKSQPASSGGDDSETHKALSASYAAARLKYADLDERFADTSRPYTTWMAEELADDGDAFEVLYHLGEDPDEVQRISQLTKKQQQREVYEFAKKYRARKAASGDGGEPTDNADGEGTRAPVQSTRVSRAAPVPASAEGGPARNVRLDNLDPENPDQVSGYMAAMNAKERSRPRF